MYQNTAFLSIYVYSLVLIEVLSELPPLAFMVIIDRVFGLSRWWLWHFFPIRKGLPFPALIYTHWHSKLYGLPWKKPAPNKFCSRVRKTETHKNSPINPRTRRHTQERVPPIPAKSCAQYSLNDAMVGQEMCHVSGPWRKRLPDKSHQRDLIEVLMLAPCQVQCPLGGITQSKGLSHLSN